MVERDGVASRFVVTLSKMVPTRKVLVLVLTQMKAVWTRKHFLKGLDLRFSCLSFGEGSHSLTEGHLIIGRCWGGAISSRGTSSSGRASTTSAAGRHPRRWSLEGQGRTKGGNMRDGWTRGQGVLLEVVLVEGLGA
jgi:hypothetical protein